MRVRMVMAGLGAIGAGAVGAVAVAGGDERRGIQTFSYTSETTTVANDDQDVARASCGVSPAVGGGVDLGAPRHGFEVASSAPDDDSSDPDTTPNDLWAAWANNDHRSVSSVTMVSHVVCAASMLELSYVERDFPVPNNRTRTAKRACPPSTAVLSGGVFLTGSGVGAEVPSMGPFDGEDGDRRPDDGFRASASGDREGAQTATVYAICSANSEVRYVKREKKLRRRHGASAVARCAAANHSATGGGSVITKPTRRIELSASAPWDSNDLDSGPSNGWSGGAFNGERKARTLTVWAICVVA